MREFTLHRIWKQQEFPRILLFTTAGDSLQILSAGFPNTGSGPDFHHARIRINDQLWSGHVELHIRASDWYLHRHHQDEAFNTVILHVVWCADAEVRHKDGTQIPTLELSRYISSEEILKAPKVDRPLRTQGILCSSLLHSLPRHLVHSWKEELYGERVRQKSEEIIRWKSRSAHFWDHLFFKALLKGFGLNLNGEAFASLADAIPYRVLRRIRSDLSAMESLLFGLSGLLDRAGEVDAYSRSLLREYSYLKIKFKLSSDACQSPLFFSLRPSNFPTIRLSQLAVLYHRSPDLFENVRNARTLEDVRNLLQTEASIYWHTHHTFGKLCASVSRKTSTRFTDLLILNTVIPALMAFGQKTGQVTLGRLNEWAGEIKAEDNRVIRDFKQEGICANSAQESQALLELYNRYCLKNKCLHCRWGIYLLFGKY